MEDNDEDDDEDDLEESDFGAEDVRIMRTTTMEITRTVQRYK